MLSASHCRSCGSTSLEDVLDLGSTPLANALLRQDQLCEEERMYPLKLIWCRGCSLLQISEDVPGHQLFSHYPYRSSTSHEFLTHCRGLAHRIIREQKLSVRSLVIDIGSNDGYLLRFYREKNIPILGIEPAQNIARIAVEAGIPTVAEFFCEALARKLADEGRKADVIHVLNCIPHVDDQLDFMKGVQLLLKENGLAIIEFAYLGDTLDRNEFDQIYHEHKCYFSLTSFQNLCHQAGLCVSDVERLPIHGGSLRVFLRKCMPRPSEAKPQQAFGRRGLVSPPEAVRVLLQEEEQQGLSTIEPYKAFVCRVGQLRENLVSFLRKLKHEGRRIAAYGASAKGCTLLHTCGVGGDMIDYVVDRSVLKQGYYTPGTHLKIDPVEKLLDDRPDYTLLLTWNFAEEILEQQKEYRQKGGRFILPIPAPTVV